MELTITQQTIKGGSEVLMVRLGKKALLSFPLDMRDLAASMVDQGLRIDEQDGDDLVALVSKFSEMKRWYEGNDNNHTPDQPRQLEPAPVPQPPRTNTLGELLDCARVAEIEFVVAQGVYQEAAAALEDAEQKARFAWTTFNDALRRELPDGSQVAVTRLDQ